MKNESPLDILPWPEQDFSNYGNIEVEKMDVVRRTGGRMLHRNWVTIPHVTTQSEIDVTALEQLRNDLAVDGQRINILPWIVKAVVSALKKYPRFNASLGADGKSLILKKYFNIGVAVNTDRGLLVPVIRECDKKSISEIAGEVRTLASNAREKGLSTEQMSGGCFSISSLGGMFGTFFTPVINAPEVAILGVSRVIEKPIRKGEGIEWRKFLPLSLSWDHRAINGVEAAEFAGYLAEVLSTPEKP